MTGAPPSSRTHSAAAAAGAPLSSSRRGLLTALVWGWLASSLACGAAPAPSPPPPAPPNRSVARLTELFTVAGLQWLVVVKPNVWLGNVHIAAGLKRLLHDERLNALELTSGIDLRATSEVVLAGYPDARRPSPSTPSHERASSSARGQVIAYALRHTSSRRLVEKRFRDRLTSGVQRHQLGRQLVLVEGLIGAEQRALACVGPEVCVFQFGGDPRRGPAAIATLYAQHKLATVAAVGRDPASQAVFSRLGDSALRMLWPGPFDGELSRGARGLMASASAVGGALHPLNASQVRLQVVFMGEYGSGGARATSLLRAAWNDLAYSDLGHLLGLQQPLSPLAIALDEEALWLSITLDEGALLDGLAAATVDDVRALMR